MYEVGSFCYNIQQPPIYFYNCFLNGKASIRSCNWPILPLGSVHKYAYEPQVLRPSSHPCHDCCKNSPNVNCLPFHLSEIASDSESDEFYKDCEWECSGGYTAALDYIDTFVLVAKAGGRELIATDEKDLILGTIPLDKKETGSKLYEFLIDGQGGLQALIESIKEKDPDKVSVKLSSSLDTIAQLELLQRKVFNMEYWHYNSYKYTFLKPLQGLGVRISA
eukprot:Gb_21663 [translate_table: standard]